MSYNFNSNQRQQLLNFLNNNYGQRYSGVNTPTSTVQVDTPKNGVALNTNVCTPTSVSVSSNLANTASVSVTSTSNAYTPSCVTYTASIPVTGTSNAQTPLVSNTQCVAKTNTNISVTGTCTVTPTISASVYGSNLTNSELWSATMNKIMSDYPKGNLSTDDLKSLLKLLNIDVQETTSGNRTVITFSAYGKSYMVSCTKTAAQSGVDTKRVTTYTKSYIQDYLGIKNDSIIERFFDVVSKTNGSTNQYTVKEGLTLSKIRSAIIKENYLSGAVGEAKTETSYKTNLTKIQESTSLTAENVNSNENNAAVINKVAQDFASGNLSTTVLRSVLSAIGITPKVELKNSLYTVSFKFDGKQYSISCNAEAAQKSFDDKNVETVDIQYLKKQYGLSENLLKQLADMGHLNSVYSCDGRTLVYSYNPEEFSSNLEESLLNIFNSKNNQALLDEYVMTMASNLSDYMLENYGYRLPEDLFANETDKNNYFFELFAAVMNSSNRKSPSLTDYQTIMSEVAYGIDYEINIRNNYILNEFLNNYELRYKFDNSRANLSENYFYSDSYSNFVNFEGDIPEIQTETVENVIDKLVPLFAKGNMQLDMLNTLLQACKIEPQIIEDDSYVSVSFIFNGDSYTINCSKSAIKSCEDNYKDGYVIGECPNVNIYDVEFIKKYYGYTQAELDALTNIGALKVATAKNGIPQTYSVMTQEEYFLSEIEDDFAKVNIADAFSGVTRALYHDAACSVSLERLDIFLKQHQYSIWDANEGTKLYDISHSLNFRSHITFKMGVGRPFVDIESLDNVNSVLDLLSSIKNQTPPYEVYIGESVTDDGLNTLTTLLDAWNPPSSGASDAVLKGSHFYNYSKSGSVYSDTIKNLDKSTMDKLVYENHTNETLAALLDERFSTEFPNEYDNRFLNCDIDLRTLLDTISLSGKSLDDVYTELLDKANQIFTKREGLVNSLSKAGINEDTINKLKLGRFATQMNGLSDADSATLVNNLVEIAKYYQNTSEESIKAQFASVYKEVTGKPINSDMLNSIDAKKLFISTVNNYDLEDDILVNLKDVVGISALSVDAAAQQSALVNSDSTKVLIGLSQDLLEQFLSECWDNEDISSITQDDILKYINQSLSDSKTMSTLKILFGEDVDFASNFYAMMEQTLASLLNMSVPEMRKALCNGGIKLVTIADAFKAIQSADSTTGTSARRAAATRSTQNTQTVRPYKNPFTNNIFNKGITKLDNFINDYPIIASAVVTQFSLCAGAILGGIIGGAYGTEFAGAAGAEYGVAGGGAVGLGAGAVFAYYALENGFRNTVDDIVDALDSSYAKITMHTLRGATSVIGPGKHTTNMLEIGRSVSVIAWKCLTRDDYGKKFHYDGYPDWSGAALNLAFDVFDAAANYIAMTVPDKIKFLENYESMKKLLETTGGKILKQVLTRLPSILNEIYKLVYDENLPANLSDLNYANVNAVLNLIITGIQKDWSKLFSKDAINSWDRVLKLVVKYIKDAAKADNDTGTSSSSSSPLTAADVNKNYASKTGSDGLSVSSNPPSDTSYTPSCDPPSSIEGKSDLMDALYAFLNSLDASTTSTSIEDGHSIVSKEYDYMMAKLQTIVQRLKTQGLSQQEIESHPDYIEAWSALGAMKTELDMYNAFDTEVLASLVVSAETSVSDDVLSDALSAAGEYSNLIAEIVGSATSYSEISRRISYYIQNILSKS